MIKVLAIDPGREKSGFVVWDGIKIYDMGIVSNEEIIEVVLYKDLLDYIAIEMVAHYGTGMPAGAEVFDTCVWIGRFVQEASHIYDMSKIRYVFRKVVRLHLCGTTKAKKSNTKQVLRDRFEPDLVGRQRPKGVLKGLKDHMWSAMEVAVTFLDKLDKNSLEVDLDG